MLLHRQIVSVHFRCPSSRHFTMKLLTSHLPFLVVAMTTTTVSTVSVGGSLSATAEQLSPHHDHAMVIEERELKKKKKPKSTECATDIVSSTVNCNHVKSMKWFLNTKKGIASLQGLTRGLSLDQIKKRTTKLMDASLSTDGFVKEQEDRTLKKKKSKSSKATDSPTSAPTLPLEKLSSCARHLKDPCFIVILLRPCCGSLLQMKALLHCKD